MWQVLCAWCTSRDVLCPRLGWQGRARLVDLGNIIGADSRPIAWAWHTFYEQSGTYHSTYQQSGWWLSSWCRDVCSHHHHHHQPSTIIKAWFIASTFLWHQQQYEHRHPLYVPHHHRQSHYHHQHDNKHRPHRSNFHCDRQLLTAYWSSSSSSSWSMSFGEHPPDVSTRSIGICQRQPCSNTSRAITIR